MLMAGKFIVLDGTDGSGKGTQTALCVERLKAKGYPVETIDFPQYGQKSAALVEEYLNGKFGAAEEVGPYRASIFYACDRYAASFRIKGWLNSGKIVIANRYISSNIGHQAGKIKDPEERDKFISWLENLEYGIFGIPRPHLTLFLFVPVEFSSKLVEKKDKRDYIEGGKAKDIHESDIAHLKDSQEAYLAAAKKIPQWKKIGCLDGKRLMSIQEINELIIEEIERII